MNAFYPFLLLVLAALPGACLAGGGGMGGGGGMMGGGSNPDLTGFNAVQPGGAYNGVIYTKLVGSAFDLDILALRSSNTAIYTGFSGSVGVQLLDASNDSGAMDPNTGCRESWSPISGASTTASGFGNGRKTVSFTVNKAYRDVVVKMTYSYTYSCRGGHGGKHDEKHDGKHDGGETCSGSIVSCSSDNFAIRPTNITVSSNMTNTGSSGTPKAKAGANFTLTATAVAGYDGTPEIDNTKVQAHAGATANGMVTGAFGAANPSNGQASGSSFSYSEVGLFRFAANGVYDDSFTAVDSAWGECVSGSFSDSPSGGKYGCNFGNDDATSYFGRFYPDHFDVAKNTPKFRPAAGSFTYLGQPFHYATQPVLTVTAKNAAGNPTTNYTGEWMKITAGTLTGKTYTSASGTLDTSGITGTDPVIADLGGGVVSLTFGSGSGLKFQRGGNPVAPFNAEISLAIHVADADGAAYGSNPARFGAAAAGQGIAFDDGNAATTTDNQMRFGRLRLANAHGSELLPLPVRLVAEYWDGQGFVTNTADNTTTLAAPGLTFHGESADNRLGSGETTASLSSPLISGSAGLTLSAPGAGNHGYLDLGVAAPDWLKYNWDGVDQGGDGNWLDDTPSARVTFGKRRGLGGVILRREVY